MFSQLEPITVYGQGGPNPPKVAMVLEELEVPYVIDPVPFSDIKKPAYVAINPNGRLPSIHDPNTGITLWESGAIVEYLIDRYDKEHKLSFASGTIEAYHAKQWLFFQVSGQGPYFGQAVWFIKFHGEKVQSAIDRYTAEVNRVTGVLESWLEQQQEKYQEQGDGPWLVGNKCSFADIAFISWHNIIQLLLSKDQFDIAKYPLVNAWLEKLNAREKVKKVMNALPPPSA